MAKNRREQLAEWLQSGSVSLHPLSFPQRELWESTAYPPEDASNNICAPIRIRGKVAVDDWVRPFELVAGRQDVLRLSFLPGREGPLQLVRDSLEPVIRFHDRSASSTPFCMEDVDAFAQEPFNLVQGPLYRVDVLHLAEDDCVLVFTAHHAIADGWTLGVLVRDLLDAYLHVMAKRSDGLSPVEQTYVEWCDAERSFWTPTELQRRATFWRSTLLGVTRRFPVSPSAVRSRLESRIPEALTESASALARRSGLTLFEMLLATFQLAMSQWTRTDDVLVATPVAHRSRRETQSTMGYYSGIVPLRGHVEPSVPLDEHLAAARTTSVESFAQAMPMVELEQAIGDVLPEPGHSVFEVRFALQNHPMPKLALPELSLDVSVRSSGTARYVLACEITEDSDELAVVWLYDPTRLGQAEVEELNGLFVDVLGRMCRADSSTRLARILP